MLFVDYSSAFNTIISSKLVSKLDEVEMSICRWIFSFLTGRSHMVKVSDLILSLLILNTGTTQGCMLSPLLYSLFTHDCVAKHSSNTIIKYVDDTCILGLFTDNDETAYREEVKALAKCTQDNNLSLNTSPSTSAV